MSALAAYRTAILALVDDASQTRFTSAQVDAALEWALAEYSKCRPLLKSYLLDTDGTCRLALPDEISAAVRAISRVSLYNADPRQVQDVVYYAYKQDETWLIETLLSTYASGQYLTVEYAAIQTIDGLDSAAGTTVPGADEWLIQLGAAGHAAQMRAISRSETFNLNAEAVKFLRDMAKDYLATFREALTPENPAPVFADLTMPDAEV
jgi:hypothetical protein